MDRSVAPRQYCLPSPSVRYIAVTVLFGVALKGRLVAPPAHQAGEVFPFPGGITPFLATRSLWRGLSRAPCHTGFRLLLSSRSRRLPALQHLAGRFGRLLPYQPLVLAFILQDPLFNDSCSSEGSGEGMVLMSPNIRKMLLNTSGAI